MIEIIILGVCFCACFACKELVNRLDNEDKF